MHMVWGILMVAIGLLMLIWGSAKSEFVIYRILVERSKKLWVTMCIASIRLPESLLSSWVFW